MTQRYFDDWEAENYNGLSGFDAMVNAFGPRDVKIKDENVIFAAYGLQGYEGYAFVLFRQDGKLYEVHAAHCSCNALGGQWKPEKTTWTEIEMRHWGLSDETNAALAALVATHTEGR